MHVIYLLLTETIIGPFLSEAEAQSNAAMVGLDPDDYEIRPLNAPTGPVHEGRYHIVARPHESDGPCRELAELRLFRQNQEVTSNCHDLSIEANPRCQAMEVWFVPRVSFDEVDCRFPVGKS